MTRIIIWATDEESGEKVRVGHFESDTATSLPEGEYWDGRNMRGNISGMQINRAELWHTAGGRWVEHADHSPEFNGPDVWRFLTDEQAREWLLKADTWLALGALEEHFPPLPVEEGP